MQNDTLIAVDLAKSVFEVAVSDHPGQVAAGAASRDPVPGLLRPAPAGHRRHGGLRLGSLLGRAHRAARAHGRPAAAAHGAPLRSPQQDRPHRHQGHARGQPQRGDPPRPGQDRRPAGAHLAPPPPLRLDGRAHRTHQHAARPAARVRASSSRSAPVTSSPRSGPSSRTPTPSSPTPSAPLFAEVCHEIRDLEAPHQDGRAPARGDSPQQTARRRPASSPSPASACSPPPLSSPSSATSTASPPARHFASYLGLTPREHSSGLTRTARRHLQARRRLPAHPPHPRRTLGPARTPARHTARSPPRLGPHARADPRPQQGRRRRRQQARPHRLGRLEARSSPSGSSPNAA